MKQPKERAAHMEYKRISIDTSKHVFTIHGVDEAERPALRRDLRRSQMEKFFGKLERNYPPPLPGYGIHTFFLLFELGSDSR